MSEPGPSFRRRHGSPSGNYHPTSPRSTRLSDGIQDDTDYLKSRLHHLSVLDYELENVRVTITDPSYDKYRKLNDEQKLLFSALFRRAVRKNCEVDPRTMNLPAGNMDKPQVKAYSTLGEILPEDREDYRVRLSRLLVAKIATESSETEFLPLIRQLKVINETYSTSIPLVLVSNYYNHAYVEQIVKEHSDKNLIIHVSKQPLFPLVNKIGYQSKRSDDSASDPEYHFFMTQKYKLMKEQAYMLPQEVPRTEWYIPGEMYTLCEQLKNHLAANDKDYILLLNSSDHENVVDLKMLNYLCETRGRTIDILFEVVKPRESDLNNVSELLVKSGEKLKVVPKKHLEDRGYDIAENAMVITNNMWINIPFLKTEESDAMLLRLTTTRVSEMPAATRVESQVENEVRLEMPAESEVDKEELRLEMTVAALVEDAHCAAVEVPTKRVVEGGPLGSLWDLIHPTCFKKHKVKTGLTYLFSYACYHGLIYAMTASLHQTFLKSHDSGAVEDGHRKNDELILFWTENGAWLILIYLYVSFLTSQRLKMAKWGRSQHERESRYRADAWLTVLLCTTRFLYTGFNRTSEVRNWCGGNAWLYLLPLHGLSFLFEFLGSLLIMFLIHPPNVMEPLETS